MGKQETLTPDALAAVEKIARHIKRAKTVVAFTGAGISTESGIPDYRSQGGLWDKFQPVYFDEFMSSKDARIEYWKQRVEMEKGLRHAAPNKGHKALARLSRAGRLTAVITQNIDGLHQASGIDEEKVIELHGNSRRIRCMSCSSLTSWDDAMKRISNGDLAPECDCGGYFKPDTVSFGQAMPERETREAARLSSQSDVFIATGSTLLVQPAASMPEYARSAGAFVAIINLSQTPFDSRCNLMIREKAGPVLDALANRVLNE
ncbi:MAG TPA: sigma factor regulator FecR [Desulfobacteraceae bacterium]|nr:sigma factor regulator FecR [Desulfobacteraceae bacterium]|tara:strand:+ start:116 stop:901 length:786 start_codon:yes stop_codon:yes gene_type:complete